MLYAPHASGALRRASNSDDGTSGDKNVPKIVNGVLYELDAVRKLVSSNALKVQQCLHSLRPSNR